MKPRSDIQGRARSHRELIANPSGASSNWRVQFEFTLSPSERASPNEFLALTDRRIPMALIRNPRARRYVLRLRPDGSARVTIPRGGSVAEARRFAERNRAWLERALQRMPPRATGPRRLFIGTQIHFRGELVTIEAGLNGQSSHIRFGTESILVKDPTADLRRIIEGHLWKLAARELPLTVLGLAAVHQLTVGRVTVRNQRSRWGSCSRRGTISLNWRLIQAPPPVRDYLVLHELMHLRQMNHSSRFWAEVERVCPDFRSAERWLKEHSALLSGNNSIQPRMDTNKHE